jgi:dipeptidyl-peptidase III
MVRAGIRALEFFDVAKNKHGQAHMQARCVHCFWVVVTGLMFYLHRLGITQFLIRKGIAWLEEKRDASGKLENMYIRVSPISPLFLGFL